MYVDVRNHFKVTVLVCCVMPSNTTFDRKTIKVIKDIIYVRDVYLCDFYRRISLESVEPQLLYGI